MAGFLVLLPLPLPAPPPAGEGPREGWVKCGYPAAASAGGYRSPTRVFEPRPGSLLARMGCPRYDGLTNRPYSVYEG